MNEVAELSSNMGFFIVEKNIQCLICDSYSIKPLVGYYSKHRLLKCHNCGFVFMEQIPTSKELEEYYRNYTYDYEGFLSPITIKSYNHLLDEFEVFRQTNQILDVGCGKGWFLMEAKKRNWKVFGTEHSKTAMKQCAEKGINMELGELNPENYECSNFDIITSFEVIEHINNPIQVVKSISKLLRNGGLFYCTTPNFNSLMRYYLRTEYDVISYPEHLSYYTKTTLTKLLENNSFKSSKVLSTGLSISRIKTSKKISTETIIAKNSSDEVIRRNIDKYRYLKFLKVIINKMLNWTSTGMTLKGYYIKI